MKHSYFCLQAIIPTTTPTAFERRIIDRIPLRRCIKRNNRNKSELRYLEKNNRKTGIGKGSEQQDATTSHNFPLLPHRKTFLQRRQDTRNVLGGWRLGRPRPRRGWYVGWKCEFCALCPDVLALPWRRAVAESDGRVWMGLWQGRETAED